MAILSPEDLLDQARSPIAPLQAGPPRQVDLRRAISAAYYAVFHYTLTKIADEFVGKTLRTTPRYALIYRSIDHRTLRFLCNDVSKSTAPQKYAPYPLGGLGPDIQAFATTAADLQERRHQADYDPQPKFRAADATVAVEFAKRAMQRFERAPEDARKAFLALLLCPPRGS